LLNGIFHNTKHDPRDLTVNKKMFLFCAISR
jgi:hypothetical protein